MDALQINGKYVIEVVNMEWKEMFRYCIYVPWYYMFIGV